MEPKGKAGTGTQKEGKQMIEKAVSRLVAILIVFAALGGCGGSKPANFYVLYSLQDQGAGVSPAASENGIAVGVGPVRIPDYLDRPQMATRSTLSHLQFAEFDKWSESLEKNLTRVIADNLAVLIPSDRVSIYPWQKSMMIQLQVTLDVTQLDHTPDGKVILGARWNVFRGEGDKLLMMKRSTFKVPVESSGYDGIASAESRAVEALSREIAAAVKSLPVEAVE
jgi:uncharacterized protein